MFPFWESTMKSGKVAYKNDTFSFWKLDDESFGAILKIEQKDKLKGEGYKTAIIMSNKENHLEGFLVTKLVSGRSRCALFWGVCWGKTTFDPWEWNISHSVLSGACTVMSHWSYWTGPERKTCEQILFTDGHKNSYNTSLILRVFWLNYYCWWNDGKPGHLQVICINSVERES